MLVSTRMSVLGGIVARGLSSAAAAKKVDYDFTGTTMPSGISVVRNQTAPCIGLSGTYSYVAANTGRLDHASDGTPRGLIVEPMASNYCPQSRNLTSWAMSGTNVTGSATSFDGTATAFKITPTTANTYHDLRISSMSYTGKNVVLSAIVKSAGYRYCSLGISINVTTWSSECSIVLDTTTGTTALKSRANYVLNASGAINIGNGFWLMWANVDISNATATAVYIAATPQSSGVTGSWAGDGTSGVICAGVQVEPAWSTTQGPSGIISTTTGNAQRPPELVSFAIPSGVDALLYTFDDASTQIIAVSPGSYTIPTNLCKGRRIKKIENYAGTYTVPSLFLETDFSSDVGDLFGLQILLAEVLAGKCRLIGVNTNTYNTYSAPAVAAVLKHCGFGYVPVGAYQGSEGTAASAGSGYTSQLVTRFGTSGDVRANYLDGKSMLRSVLAQQPNGSVTIVSIGLFMNLRDLVNSAADAYSTLNGVDLISAKVAKFSIMAGYAAGGTEWNFSQMPSSGAAFVSTVPVGVPCYYVGYELGGSGSFTYPAGDVYSNPFSYACSLVGGTSNKYWDQLSVMYAAAGTYVGDFYNQYPNGTMTVNSSTGANSWSSTPTGNVTYLGASVSYATLSAQINATIYSIT